MLVLIDNYDSFTWNLVHYFGQLGAEMKVFRNDETTPEAILSLKPAGVVLSPGPCDPDRAGICLPMIARAAETRLPLFGVCLGHQAIGQAYGGEVIRAKQVMHGKVSKVRHNDKGIFKGLPNPFTATRYHSLAVRKEDLPPELEVTAWTDDGEIMGVQHRTRPVFGVQFHPESIATEGGHQMLANFMDLAGVKRDTAVWV